MDWKKYVFNLDFFVFFCLVIFILYIVYKRGRKVKKFNIPYITVDKHKKKKSISKREKKKKKKAKLNKHEEECRRIFQSIFKVKFKSVRPKWLKNPVTNKNLELDGFNPDIKTPLGNGLAFEYDGKQHSSYVPHFHKNGVKEFEYQVAKDSWKDKKCEENNILLIRIPHFVAFHDLDRYIRMILKRKSMLKDDPKTIYTNYSSNKNIYE